MRGGGQTAQYQYQFQAVSSALPYLEAGEAHDGRPQDLMGFSDLAACLMEE